MEKMPETAEAHSHTLRKYVTFYGLCEWYDYMLQKRWKYVAYAAKESYALAQIMSQISGKIMEQESHAVFLTDGALYLHCGCLADYFKKYRKFPEILLCDCVMLHGRSVNHVLDAMEKELCRVLPEFSRERVIMAFADAITVHVYVRTARPLILFSRYEKNMHFVKKEDPAFCHQVSSDISSLLLYEGMAGTGCIFTIHISDEDGMKIHDLDSYVKTVYQNTIQYIKLDYIKDGSRVCAVFSLRLVKAMGQDGYHAVPFVFLPNLDSEETKMLSAWLKEKIADSSYASFLDGLECLHGKRSFNEIVSMLLSNAVLQSFCKRYGIKADKMDEEKSLARLSRNYNQKGFAWTKQMLDYMLHKEMFSVEEAGEFLIRNLKSERKLFNLEGFSCLNKQEEDEIKKKIEGVFYNCGLQDEKSAYDLSLGPYYQTNLRICRKMKNLCFAIEKLNTGCTQQESMLILSYLLQIMDAGAADISSFPPANIKVLGYAQFIGAGWQSFALKPLYMNEYIPMLDAMQSVCSHWLVSFSKELDEYLNAFPEHYPDETLMQIHELAEDLKSVGQMPSDWIGMYVRKIKPDEQQMMEHMKKQDMHISHYMKWAKNRIN